MDARCESPEGLHAEHFAVVGGQPVHWPNEEWERTRRPGSLPLKDMATRVHRNIARREDPVSAHLAAAVAEPRRGSRKALVLNYLRQREGMWVNGYDLATPDVGGSEGLRRVRELRSEGHAIEVRLKPDTEVFQYRRVSGLSSGS